MYAVDGSLCEGSMRLTYPPLGTPCMRPTTLLQVLPPSRDICTLPSSVPTHNTPAFTGDSAIAVIQGHATTPSWRESVLRSTSLPRMVILLRSAPVVRSSPRRVQL